MLTSKEEGKIGIRRIFEAGILVVNIGGGVYSGVEFIHDILGRSLRPINNINIQGICYENGKISYSQ